MPVHPHKACVRVGVPLALLIAALTTAIAGCGSGNGIASKSPAQILAASRTAALNATSVRVLSEDSQDKGKLSLTLGLELARNGGRAKLSFLKLSYEAIRIANTLYVKGNQVFDRRLDRSTGLHVPHGVWLKAPADSGRLAGLASLTDLRSELTLLLRSTGPMTKGNTTTVDKQKVIELRQPGKHSTGALYIATTGNPYPIQHLKHGQETGHTTFTGWNQPITLRAPANTIEFSNLEKR